MCPDVGRQGPSPITGMLTLEAGGKPCTSKNNRCPHNGHECPGQHWEQKTLGGCTAHNGLEGICPPLFLASHTSVWLAERVLWSLPVFLCKTITTKYHRLGRWSSKHLPSNYTSGGWEGKIRVSAGLFSPEASLLGLQMAVLSLCPSVYVCVYISSWILVIWDKGSPMWPHLTLIFSLKTQSSNLPGSAHSKPPLWSLHQIRGPGSPCFWNKHSLKGMKQRKKEIKNPKRVLGDLAKRRGAQEYTLMIWRD